MCSTVKSPTPKDPKAPDPIYMHNPWLDGLGISGEQHGRNSLRIDLGSTVPGPRPVKPPTTVVPPPVTIPGGGGPDNRDIKGGTPRFGTPLRDIAIRRPTPVTGGNLPPTTGLGISTGGNLPAVQRPAPVTGGPVPGSPYQPSTGGPLPPTRARRMVTGGNNKPGGGR